MDSESADGDKLREAKIWRGFKRVSVSLEQGLLKRVTALAKQRRVSRSTLFAQALEEVLARK
jgi:metal-responsive CopG/Arc/MetJ family transcriptional regulator